MAHVQTSLPVMFHVLPVDHRRRSVHVVVDIHPSNDYGHFTVLVDRVKVEGRT